ncbi:methyl-accepting chemotaxis protein [Paraburkholderia steynii]|uniref:Methyl-accepting chemotaxis protein n=1 Tax=Paraburkholderia steynii TaxID=1245441 RepID=A0A7Z7FJE4_9BURK|nr:methyl-accepting chemotaxis protein [Paraburkholderia steynii]SDI56152.1 methyl-accepting chemotaxis protein [Paraburkholderia steynii]
MTNIRSRLSLILAALGVLCMAIASIALHGLAEANERADVTYQELMLPAQHGSNAYRNGLLMALQIAEIQRLNDLNASQAQFEALDRLVPMVKKDIELFNSSKKPVALESAASTFGIDFDKWMSALRKAEQVAKSGDISGSLDVVKKESRPYGLAAVQDMMQFTTLLNSEAEAAHTRAMSRYATIRAWVIGALLIGGIVCGLVASWQMRLLGRSLTGIQETLHDASRSLDLTKRAESSRNDEIGRTASAFNELIGRVAGAMSGVRTAAGAVHTAALEIASGNEDLSARTEEQATSLEQTAASMTQLTETVKHNADNARQANVLASRATGLADTGNDAVQGMVHTIGQISGSSTKISEITGVIEGIAFQTNILALNAAVEAARAGEQGRGFAVVASEVRSLAQRSAAAAKEIKELIGSSVAMIQDGVQQASEVGATMGQVKQAIKQVSDIVGEIAVASEEQSRGIEQVHQAVSQMDEVTQQNAALVEQAAAAAHSLEEQAIKLKDAVSVFKVADAGHDPVRGGAPLSGLSTPALKTSGVRPQTKMPVQRAIASAGVATGTSASSRDNEWETF